jgi:hypothetical protein
MRRERTIKKTCQRCGAEFYAASNRAMRCEECRVIWEKEQNTLRKREYRAKTQQIPKKSLNEIMRDLRKYNEQNGTQLTYGQYVKNNNL